MTEQPKPERKARKSPAAAAADHAPWLPTDWTPADALAMQRLSTGAANAEEQKTALRWILRCSGVTDEPYRPGEDGRRETDYALGKANVGRQIAKLARINLSLLRGDEHGENG